MSLKKFAKAGKGVKDEAERVGGGYYVPESGIYEYTITKAYADESKSGSQCIALELTSAEHTFEPKIYYTTGKAKGQNTFYERDGEKKSLPSFLLMQDLCMILTGKELAEQDTEIKSVKLYDYEAKKDIAKKREVLVDLLGNKILVAVRKVLEDGYKDPSKEVTKLDIKKFFDAETKLTATETINEAEEHDFYTKWLDRFKDNTEDKRNESKNPSAASSSGFDTDSVDDDSPFGDDEVTEETVSESEEEIVEEEEDIFG